MTETESSPPAATDHRHQQHIDTLVADVAQQGSVQGLQTLLKESDQTIAEVLLLLSHPQSLKILARLKKGRRTAILALLPRATREQWALNLNSPVNTVGRLMEKPVGLFRPELTVREAVDMLRVMVKSAFITYGYVTDGQGILLGVLVMRDLLLADPAEHVAGIMIRDPFFLTPRASVAEAVRAVWNKHYPVYPVCSEDGTLVGLVRGHVLFEEQTTRVSAQAGRMVGVGEEDRLGTPWWRSFRFRHPWLQLNLVTAFLAAAVVGAFEGTIEKVVVLAVFLPVLAGQSGNTGCQALAVALRGITLGDLKRGKERQLVIKEVWLGLLNGALVGVVAAGAMFAYASLQHHPRAVILALVVLLAMISSCIVSGIFGAIVPITLKRLGADPATASSIFVTTATDVASMGLFLGLATWLVL